MTTEGDCGCKDKTPANTFAARPIQSLAMPKIITALQRIASASPCVRDAGSDKERRCPMCEAFINEAREALGLQAWPAEYPTKHP